MAKQLAVCNLCEAICGLELTIEDGAVTAVRGNEDDPLSRGHICPKGVAIADIYSDPDRLRRPVRRIGTGASARWEEISWDEAFDAVADGFASAINQHGRDALGIYLGNPSVHSLGALTHGPHTQQVQRDVGRPASPSAAVVPDVRAPAATSGAGHRSDAVLPGVRR
jgi:anaerobic selenocysteine-containing dehydrogenase